jgi:hypothetical protein
VVKTRAKITRLGHNEAELTYLDERGAEVTRCFYAPLTGGFVREILRGGAERPHVHASLDQSGPKLSWSGIEPLVDLIRLEWRRRRHEDARS